MKEKLCCSFGDSGVISGVFFSLNFEHQGQYYTPCYKNVQFIFIEDMEKSLQNLYVGSN
jgi:hypothetical protein